jgi:hypothetical protein
MHEKREKPDEGIALDCGLIACQANDGAALARAWRRLALPSSSAHRQRGSRAAFDGQRAATPASSRGCEAIGVGNEGMALGA